LIKGRYIWFEVSDRQKIPLLACLASGLVGGDQKISK
jgi:hypothetical protein